MRARGTQGHVRLCIRPSLRARACNYYENEFQRAARRHLREWNRASDIKPKGCRNSVEALRCPLSAANEYRIFLADVNIVIYARDKLLSSRGPRRDTTFFIVPRHCALPCTLPMFLEIYLSVRLMGLVREREQGSGPRRNHALRLGNSSGDECYAARFRSLPIQSVLSFTKKTPIIAGLLPGRLRALRCR